MMNVQGLAWLLLRACKVSDQHLMNLLTPMQGQFPATEQQLDQMFVMLRRMGHILEQSPGNLATALQGGGPRTSTFLTSDESVQQSTWNDQQEHAPAASWGQSASSPVSFGGQQWDTWGTESDSQAAFLADYGYDSGTDTDTASSEGATTYELDVPPEIASHPGAVAQHLFWAYERAKKAWRSYMQKPVRRVRRYLKTKGKGKGKSKHGKGKGSLPHYLASLQDDQTEQLFAAFRQKGKGKGKGNKSGGEAL